MIFILKTLLIQNRNNNNNISKEIGEKRKHISNIFPNNQISEIPEITENHPKTQLQSNTKNSIINLLLILMIFVIQTLMIVLLFILQFNNTINNPFTSNNTIPKSLSLLLSIKKNISISFII